MKPLVSILIPAYNAGPLDRGHDQVGIARRHGREKEIIVVDDGSKDETFSVAQKFSLLKSKSSPRKNQGASAARNKAFSLAQGDYIQWLDADDLLSPDKFTKQMEAAERLRDKRALPSSRRRRLPGMWVQISAPQSPSRTPLAIVELIDRPTTS